MTSELTTVVGQLSISGGKLRNMAPNQVAVREPKSENAPGVGKGDLFIITEIQGRVADRDALEQHLAQVIRDAYYLSRGSITASLRRAMQTGSDLLYGHNQKRSVTEQVVGGAVALVTSQEDAFVAQIGPAACFAVLGDHIRRYPGRSTWLDEAVRASQDAQEAALGLSNVIEPNLHHLRVASQDKLVLTDSRLAARLPLKTLVHAVDSGPVKTAVKKLEQVARAESGSAIVLEVIETKSATLGPLKIGTTPQLGGLFQRQRSQSSKAKASVEPQVDEQAMAAEWSRLSPEPATENESHSSATFNSTSIMQKPWQWLGSFTHKPASPAPPLEPSSQPKIQTQPVETTHKTSPPQFEEIDHNWPEEDDMMQESREHENVMNSMAPDTALRTPSHQSEPGNERFTVKKFFRGIGLGILMLVMLLGSGLKTILNLILPGMDNQLSARQAGTQAQPDHPSGSSWTLLRNVAIAIPILVALVVAVNYLQKGRLREAEYTEFVTTAQQKFEQAQVVEVTAALGLINEAESALIQAEQLKENQPEIATLRQQMAEEADRVGNVQRLYYLPQLRQYTDAGTNLSNIVVQGLEIYVMDSGNDRIFHHRLDDSGEALLPDDGATVVTVARGETVEDVTVEDMLAMTWMPTGGNRQTSDLVILNSTGLLEYNSNWGITSSELAGGDALMRPVAVDSYFGNFYVLDAQANTLLRYLPTADGYSTPPESYFSVDLAVNLTGAVDLAIDGSVYIMFNDGTISQYLGGQPVAEFQVTGLDKPFNNPVAIFTAPNEEIQHLYVADAGNQRLVQLNKDGSFVRQFKPRAGETVSFANLQDIFVDEIGERMIILDSNNLYLATIPSTE